MMNEQLQFSIGSEDAAIARELRRGSVGVMPTDTLFGICARMDNLEAIERIYQIKKRDKGKPFLVLASDVAQLDSYVILPSVLKFDQIISQHWPGPLTVILPCRTENVSFRVRAGGSTLAVRIPDNADVRDIVRSVGVPIVAPSANISGENPPARIGDVDERILRNVDFLVRGECKMKMASTIIDCSIEPFRVVRHGAVDVVL